MNKIKVIPGKSLPLATISSESGIPYQAVLDQLQKATSEHYRSFGSQPLQIFYEPSSGLSIRNTSAVGVLVTEDFQIELYPKIKQLDIAKCLGLAQVGGNSSLQIGDNRLKDIALKSDSSSNLVDYFAYSLLDEVIKLTHNGLISIRKDITEDTGRLTGEVLINETVAEGRAFIQPFVRDISREVNIGPNQLIKAALEVCTNSTDTYIQNLASGLLNEFKEVSSSSIRDTSLLLNSVKGFQFTVPRPDYVNALTYAQTILNGGTISEEGGTFSTPSFTLDLDKVFEDFCGYQISELLNNDTFKVELQKSFEHSMSSKISNKKIIPDVFITKTTSGEKILLDLKNKYSQLREDGGIVVSNQDLFQLSYYAKTLGVQNCILVYPSYKPAIQYPIKGSESDDAYKQKKAEKFEQILESNSTLLFNDSSVRITIYNVDLSGRVRNSVKSVAGLCQFISDQMSYNT